MEEGERHFLEGEGGGEFEAGLKDRIRGNEGRRAPENPGNPE